MVNALGEPIFEEYAERLSPAGVLDADGIILICI